MDFLKHHGEKILLLICVLALGASGFLTFQALTAPPSDFSGVGGRVAKLPPVSSNLLNETLTQISGGQAVLVVGTNLVFTSPERKTCPNMQCHALVALDLDNCPHCDQTFAIEDPDSDGDGISDRVELEFGMNPNDPSDAYGDMDGDGFSNILEITQGFDPTKADSHPPLIAQLRVDSIEHVETRIFLRGSAKGPTVYTLQIALQYPKRGVGRSSFVKEGARFGREKEFRLKKFEHIRTRTETGSKEDSFAVVSVEGVDRKLTPQKPLVVGNSSGTLLLLNDSAWTQEIRIGADFVLDGVTYTVTNIKGNAVIIQAAGSSELMEVKKPTPEEVAPPATKGTGRDPSREFEQFDPRMFLPPS